MKPVILAEKPSQAKAYADAFSVRRHEGYLELLPSPIFSEGACITWGIGHLVELKEPILSLTPVTWTYLHKYIYIIKNLILINALHGYPTKY